MPSEISVQELRQRMQSQPGLVLIDVRTPGEFQGVHACGAKNLPLDRLQASDVQKLLGGSAAPVYVICRSGARSAKACHQLEAAGIGAAVNITGGTQAWAQAGFPVNRGQGAVSVERQVRIVSGSLVVLGVTLGYFFSPYWVLLAGFVGVGMAMSGITDTCPMGTVLSWMPWNQTPKLTAGGDCCQK